MVSDFWDSLVSDPPWEGVTGVPNFLMWVLWIKFRSSFVLFERTLTPEPSAHHFNVFV